MGIAAHDNQIGRRIRGMGQESLSDANPDAIQTLGTHLKPVPRQVRGEVCSGNEGIGPTPLRVDGQDLHGFGPANERQGVVHCSTRLFAAVPSDQHSFDLCLALVDVGHNERRPARVEENRLDELYSVPSGPTVEG